MPRSLLRWSGTLLLAALLVQAASTTTAEEEQAVECAMEWEPGRIGGYRIMTIPFRAERPEDA